MKIKKFLPVIGIAIFVYILIKLDMSNILQEISNARIDFLLLALSLIPLFFITQTIKWFSIAKIQRIGVPFLTAVRIDLISLFYGFITPSKIGGVIRAEYLRKYNGDNLGKGVSNFVLDKILDISSLGFLVIIFSFMFRNIFSLSYFYYSVLIFLVLTIFLFIIVDAKRTKFFFGFFYKKLVPEKIKEKLKNGFYSFYEDMPKKRYFALFFILNIINWIVLYSITFLIGKSVGINLSFFYFLAILPIATLVGQLPITISGLGTREATMISLFSLLGIGPTKVFSMALISLLIGAIIPAIIGSFLSFKKK